MSYNLKEKESIPNVTYKLGNTIRNNKLQKIHCHSKNHHDFIKTMSYNLQEKESIPKVTYKLGNTVGIIF